jgi:CRISPR/Cas system endoribonuclease Cas6 (RAMP superfamily)
VNVVGFLTKFSPVHHPKDLVLATLNTRLNKQTMTHFKIKQTSISGEINNRKVRIQVYATEVKNKEAKLAEKLLMKHEEDPVKFVSFRMRKINIEAYQTAISLVSQHQNDLRTIVINKISEEAFFVLEGEAKQKQRVITVQHLKRKEVNENFSI